MRLSSFILSSMLLAVPAAAQTIHGSPQKAAYASPAEWPTISLQGHWLAPGVNSMPGMPSHIHLDVKPPIYGETATEKWVIPVTVTTFMDGVVISDAYPVAWTDNWVRTLNPITGMPVSVRHGTVTVQNTCYVQHGWFMQAVKLRGAFPDGSMMDLSNDFPMWSMCNPAAPEQTPGDGIGLPRIRAQVIITDPFSEWGEHIMETTQILPILGPVSADNPWFNTFFGYNYGNTFSPAPPAPAVQAKGESIFRINPDLHSGIPGTIIDDVFATTVQGGPNRTFQFPVSGFTGPTKLMFQWIKPNFDGTKVLTTNLILVEDFEATGGAPQQGVPPPPPPPVVCSVTSGDVTSTCTGCAVSPKVFHWTIGSTCTASIVPTN